MEALPSLPLLRQRRLCRSPWQWSTLLHGWIANVKDDDDDEEEAKRPPLLESSESPVNYVCTYCSCCGSLVVICGGSSTLQSSTGIHQSTLGTTTVAAAAAAVAPSGDIAMFPALNVASAAQAPASFGRSFMDYDDLSSDDDL